MFFFCHFYIIRYIHVSDYGKICFQKFNLLNNNVILTLNTGTGQKVVIMRLKSLSHVDMLYLVLPHVLIITLPF